jgi:hypothetical protein
MNRFLAFVLLIAFTGTAQATDGDLDLTFGTAGRVITNFINRDEATALAIQPDGKIVAAGFGGWYAANNTGFALARKERRVRATENSEATSQNSFSW